MSDKRALRSRMRAVRDRFVAAGAPAIGADPRFVARLTAGQVVATYAPVGSEADPAPLAQAALAAGCRLALPHVVDRATPLRFLAWDGRAPLAPGPFGLPVPECHWAEVAPDVIVAPLVAFDATLNRLGQGAGHYDRAFAAHPLAWRVGVAWSVQQVDRLPPDPWDVPLHAIITENDWWIR
jgi:5-formyltetrahydrofolate cyclo-ligase